MPFGFGASVFNEGDYVSAICSVSTGDLPLRISWSLQGVAKTSEGKSQLWDMADGIVTNPMGKRASFLNIESVGYGHTGTYTCTALMFPPRQHMLAPFVWPTHHTVRFDAERLDDL